MSVFDDPADWQVFFDAGPGGAAEVVQYHPAAVTVDFDLPGIWTDAHALVARGSRDGGVSTTTPILTVPPAHHLRAAPVVGDELTRRAVLYRVADIQPDGSGMIRLILERA